MNNDNNTTIDWRDIGEKLRAPFNPEDVDFRPQGNPNANGKAQAVCYIDARVVADRLDEVVGPGAWSFTYQPLVLDKGQVQIAKGALTIHGVTKEDVGEASNFDPSKGCVSDALKRAAVLWGIGRYLYGVSSEWVTLDQHKHIPDETVARLRTKLPRPDGSVAHPQSTQSAWQKRPPVLAAPTPPPAAPAAPVITVVAEDDEPATPEQQERLRKYREALGITDKHLIITDNRLRRSAAEARISEYIRQWQKAKQLQTAK